VLYSNCIRTIRVNSASRQLFKLHLYHSCQFGKPRHECFGHDQNICTAFVVFVQKQNNIFTGIGTYS